ncbi:alpha/beta-hydrolase [Exidia glandulosa HHB12029]|uniref:Alpha/beta-hydrolase n=1 Tax=Exidia glandulosa HHB12029 TaxID=1314781 RepID=A0A165LQW1_EXIGL|nr:alpha/beta-hydrolase [Exidia glandulosa HHB12029]
MSPAFAALALLAASLSGCAFAKTPKPRCVDSIAHIPASANNFNVSSGALPPGNPDVLVSEAYRIQLRFCEPSVAVKKRTDTLQVLLHGIGYNEDYWDVSFQPETYSYARFAAAQGYATLNMARLGYGKSDHPDPLSIVQSPYEVAIIESIIKAARAGHVPGATRHRGHKFNTIVAVGHSYGSRLLNGIIATQPTLIDAVILSGHTHDPLDASLLLAEPARDNDPARFGQLPPGYITTLNATTRAQAFYGPAETFDPSALASDEAHKDVGSLGETLTLDFPVTSAPEFTGDVLTVNGALDILACSDATCSNIEKEAMFYPKARSAEAAVIPAAGHALTYHLSAPKFYGTIQAWLNRHGY